jgi:hypothetical protein
MSAMSLVLTVSKFLASAVFVAWLAVAGAYADLSGYWIFEAQTSDGLLRARLEFREENQKLWITLAIDNHLLKGEADTDGKQFSVLLMHSDGSGPGHDERIRLRGMLDGDRITGSFDNGTDRGTWVGRRE